MNNLDWPVIFLADYLIILLFVFAIFLRLVKVRIPLIAGLVSASLAGLLATAIKNYFYIPRPFIFSGRLPLIELLMDGSFPSSHTAVSFALAFTVFLKNRRWGSVFILFSGLVAIGRVESLVHTYQDLVGGVILAGLCTFIVKKGLTIYHSKC